MVRHWLAPGLAAGVPRGGGLLPGCNAILRGWLRALARRGRPRALARRGPGDGNGFPWGWQIAVPLVCIQVSR